MKLTENENMEDYMETAVNSAFISMYLGESSLEESRLEDFSMAFGNYDHVLRLLRFTFGLSRNMISQI